MLVLQTSQNPLRFFYQVLSKFCIGSINSVWGGEKLWNFIMQVEVLFSNHCMFWVSSSYKVIIEKLRGGRFLWKISEIWAGFWLVGNTEKKIWTDHEQLLRVVFLCFYGQKKYFLFFWKHCSVRTKKLHRIEVRKPYFFAFK